MAQTKFNKTTKNKTTKKDIKTSVKSLKLTKQAKTPCVIKKATKNIENLELQTKGTK